MRLLIGVAAIVALAGCEMASDDSMMSETSMDPLQAALSGKTATSPETGAVVTFGEDGTLGGAVSGRWTVRDGQYCRTIDSPEELAGTICQDVEIDGDQATFKRGAAGDTTWTLSDT